MIEDLKVGSVVFVLDSSTNRVVPCQLVEIVSSVSLDGNSVSHVVTTPGSKKRLVLENSSNPWFATADSAKEHLMSSASRLIDNTIRQAVDLATRTYGEFLVEDNKIVSEDTPTTSLEANSSSVYVEMAGQKVKVSLPEELVYE